MAVNDTSGSIASDILHTGPHQKYICLPDDVTTRDINSDNIHTYVQITPTMIRFTFPRRKHTEISTTAAQLTGLIRSYGKIGTLAHIRVNKGDDDSTGRCCETIYVVCNIFNDIILTVLHIYLFLGHNIFKMVNKRPVDAVESSIIFCCIINVYFNI